MFKKLIFVVVLFILFWIDLLPATKVVNKIVAVVGDKFLTLYELNKLCKPYFEKFLKSDMPPEEKELLKKEIQKKVLKDWVEDTLIGLEAKKYNLTVTDEEVEKYLEAEKKSLGEEKFKEILKQQGLTLQDYKQKLKDKLLKIKLVQLQVKEKVVITDEELKKAYKEAIKNYDDKDYKYWISILIVKNKDLTNKIYQEINQGVSLEEIVKTYPNQLKFIKNEAFKEEELAPEILETLKNLKPGDITKPININNNFYIIKLIKKGYNKPPSFEKLKPKLYKKLFEKKAQAYIEKWIKDLQEKRYIKIFL
ncbi:SurA N-terminal domain-containing protein [Thermodesulfobacterium hydrogeniphilum]|uniref:SurA N-terminal domain-containing protein n=1 Tax=Thermodesulfobacterium hydrogeniphilum TaxID=161156 RepID=UPI00056F8370|nr:SurA N-terminal domain-containing protein [Thermodesulfobacterium hydrogeniphilum]